MNRDTPTQIADYLRHGTDPDLRRRRAVIGLSLFSATMMGIISLYQTGIVRHLPEPRGKWFSTDRVNGSAQAYSILHMPDAFLGLISYAVTAALAAAGGPRRPPFLPAALAAKATTDAAMAAKLTFDQVAKHRAFCAYCLAATAATWATLPLVWRQVQSELRKRPSRSMLSPVESQFGKPS